MAFFTKKALLRIWTLIDWAVFTFGVGALCGLAWGAALDAALRSAIVWGMVAVSPFAILYTAQGTISGMDTEEGKYVNERFYNGFKNLGFFALVGAGVAWFIRIVVT